MIFCPITSLHFLARSVMYWLVHSFPRSSCISYSTKISAPVPGSICFTTQISPQHCPALLQTGKEAMVLLTIQYDYPDHILKRPMNMITCKIIGELSCGIYQLSELLKNIHIDDMPMAWLQATGNWLQIACIQLPVTWFWWSQAGSNRRPPACKAGALPAELWPPDFQ